MTGANYGVDDYGQMIADSARTSAYSQALRRSVTPDSVVLDLGSGTGIFSLLACQYGARKVYAVETSDAIVIAQNVAYANGFADRIQFIQCASTDISLPEKAHVIVADMHGTLPLFGTNVASILDARRRLLAPGGVLIPQRETLWAALVEAPKDHERLVSPWATDRFGLDMAAAREAAINSIRKTVVAPDQLLSNPQCWGELDYATLDSASLLAEIRFSVAREGTGHGLVLWFDSVLADGVELSNAPGRRDSIYGISLLPWSAPTPLLPGDTVSLRLRADFTGADYLWTWESEIKGNESREVRAYYRQSTFWGSPLALPRLRKREGAYRPGLSPKGEVDAAILVAMNGTTTIEDIALAIMERFPSHFRSLSEAMARVGDLSEAYGRDREG